MALLGTLIFAYAYKRRQERKRKGKKTKKRKSDTHEKPLITQRLEVSMETDDQRTRVSGVNRYDKTARVR